VKAETKSTKHGLYALLGYTFSKTPDTGLSDGLGSTIGVLYYPLPNIGKADKGFSQIHLTHNFTASAVYDLPFGRSRKWGTSWGGTMNAILGNWEVDVIEHAISGFPLFLITSTDNSGVNFSNNGNNFNRPNRVCNGRLSNPTVERFFDTGCFVDAPAGELGNSARTPLFGPGFVNTDFSAIKNFPVSFREGMTLQFRAEFFNLFNHPQFFQPGTDADTLPPPAGNYGAITNTVNNPRLIQFALKLRF